MVHRDIYDSSRRGEDRRRALRRGGLCFLLLLAGSTFALAQKYLVRAYTEADGLPGAVFTDATQDLEGRMWFAARRGAVIFDGQDFVTSPSEQEDTLHGCNRILFDRRGEGWAVSRLKDWTLSHFDGRQWKRVSGCPAPGSIAETPTVLAVMDQSAPTLAVVGTPGEGVWVWEGKKWETLPGKEHLQSEVVRALAVSGDRLWIGTEQGLALWERGREVRPLPQLTAAFPSPAVWGLAAERTEGGDRLWVVGRDWVGTLEGERWKVLAGQVPLQLPFGWPQTALAPDRRGGLFFGTGSGLFFLNGSTGAWAPVPLTPVLASVGAEGLCVDREGTLWAATPRGIAKLVTRRFANWDASQGLLEDEVSAVLQRSSGQFVFGHNTGLTFFDKGRPRPFAMEKISRQWGGFRVLDLSEGPDGSLWLAGSHKGLARFDPQGRMTWHMAAGGKLKRVSSVLVDRAGTVWAAGEGGLFRFEGARLVPVIITESAMDSIRRIFEDSSGTMYLATVGKGIVVRRGERWVRAQSPEGNDADNVSAVLRDHSGRVWVGTWAGLFELDGDRLRRPPEPALRLTRPVYFVLEDRKNRLWLGTNNGVIRWDGSRTVHYTARKGLAGTETNRAAGIVDRQGRVWIGTDRGVSCYIEEDDPVTGPSPVVSLLVMEGGRKGFPPEAEIELGHGDQRLHFAARAISFLEEGGITFSTRLEGFDQDWVETVSSTRYEARYGGLPPGRYRFHFRARTSLSDWSPVLSSGVITIRAPFWSRWWFMGSILAGVALLAALAQGFFSTRSRARFLESEVRRRTEALAASEGRVKQERELLAITLGSIADGVVACDPAGGVILINRAAETLTGWRSAETLGKSVLEILPLQREAGGPLETGFLDILRHPLPNSYFEQPVVLRARSGAVSLVECRVAPLLAPGGEAQGYVIVVHDVALKRRLEEERVRLERLDALGLVAGGIANDFNNLLAGILGSLSLLRDSRRLGAADLQQVSSAEQAVEQSRLLTHKLITFARGGVPVRAAVPPAELVSRLISRAFPEAADRFVLDLPPGLAAVDIDEGQVSAALQSLLANALEAAGGGAPVRIEAIMEVLPEGAVPGLAAGPYIKMTIADCGPGIPPEVLPRIFDPFFSTKPGGSGLGLSVAHSILRQHDGVITVESRPGAGSKFHLYLPAGKPVEPPLLRPPEKISRLRVLVMDDQDIVRNVVLVMLKQIGCESKAAADGAEALRLYEESRAAGKPFDVVLLDLCVPSGMDGPETLKRLRELDPRVRAIASSGYSDGAIMAGPAEAGFAAILPKPYTIADLRRVLGKFT